MKWENDKNVYLTNWIFGVLLLLLSGYLYVRQKQVDAIDYRVMFVVILICSLVYWYVLLYRYSMIQKKGIKKQKEKIDFH